jgi:hypothetical protein
MSSYITVHKQITNLKKTGLSSAVDSTYSFLKRPSTSCRHEQKVQTLAKSQTREGTYTGQLPSGIN